MSQESEETQPVYPVVTGQMHSDVFENAPGRILEDGSIMIYARPRIGKGQAAVMQDLGPAMHPDVQQE